MPSPATLITVAQLKRQLKIAHDDDDEDLSDKLADAEDVIWRFIGDRADATWTELTVPGAIRAAILRQATHYWAHRGDTEVPGLDDSGLAPGIRFMLQANGFRDLTIA